MKECAITANEMKAIDMNCHHLGMSPALLMENAGAAVAREVRKLIEAGQAAASDINAAPPLPTGPDMSPASAFIARAAVSSPNASPAALPNASPAALPNASPAALPNASPAALATENKCRILLFAGKGNNGGDAFVAARHLSVFSDTAVAVICPSPAFVRTPEARLNFDLLSGCPVRVCIYPEEYDAAAVSALSKNADIVVDGLLGTGLSGAPRENEQTLIDIIRKKRPGQHIVSIDIPSGMRTDGTLNENPPVAADVTVTFHKPKTYLETDDARKYAGKIVVAGIGVLPDAEKYAGPGDIRLLYARRASDHKGNAGKILVIGGGPYTGAPYFSGMAALLSGADIVTVLTPSPVRSAVAGYGPDLIVCGLPSGNDHLCPEDVPFIETHIRSHDVVIIGPGLGAHPETLRAVSLILPLCRKAVVDADALRPELFEAAARPFQLILTPHAGEFDRLSRRDGAAAASSDLSVSCESPVSGSSDFFAGDVFPQDPLSGEAEAVCRLARELGATIIKKGKIDIVSDGDRLRFGRTGNAGMNVGGTGDILSGIAGSLLSRNEAFSAALCAAYACGRAGDLTAAEKGNRFTASDVLEKIPDVFKNE